MQHVRPIITRHNTAKDKKYHHDPKLDSGSKVFLRKMNKIGLHDNYVGPFDVIARSEKYFTIKLSNGKIDNVTIDRVKPCFSESDTLRCPATEEYHEVHAPAPLAPAAPPAHQNSLLHSSLLHHPHHLHLQHLLHPLPQRHVQTLI